MPQGRAQLQRTKPATLTLCCGDNSYSELYGECRASCLRNASSYQSAAGQSGLTSKITIDPAVYGTGSTAGWTVFAFSQGEGDAVERAGRPASFRDGWKWCRAQGRGGTLGGVLASQYNFGYPAQAVAAGIVSIGGTTTTVLFADEFPTPASFNSAVACDAHRGNPWYAALLRRTITVAVWLRQHIGNTLSASAEIQTDGGVPGLFFDEVSGSYQGLTFNNNEGFDDADVADFGGFLCAKYPGLTAAQWQSCIGVTAADNLNCSMRTYRWRGAHLTIAVILRGTAGIPTHLPHLTHWRRKWGVVGEDSVQMAPLQVLI